MEKLHWSRQNLIFGTDEIGLGGVCHYDPAIAKRRTEVELGMSPNGHDPNGSLSKALGGTKTGVQLFSREYRWAKAVNAYRHRDFSSDNKEALMSATGEALFEAAHTYEVEREPNFLTHFSSVCEELMTDEYGEPKFGMLSADQFDKSVIRTYLMPLPPLATSRKVESLERIAENNEKVVTLADDGSLKTAKITKINRYEDPFMDGVELSDEEIGLVQEYVDCITADGFDWHNRLDRSRMIYRGGSPDALTMMAMGLLRYSEISKLPIDINTGSVQAELDVMPYGVIADVTSGTVITREEWKAIKSDRLYRGEWIRATASKNTHDGERLSHAIGEAIMSETDLFDNQADGRSRAIPKRGYYGTGVVKYGSMIA
jgi:hypothetical protein